MNMILVVAVITFGISISTFGIMCFVLSNFRSNYSGVKDLLLRGVFIVGLIINSVVLPIWLQKTMYPDSHSIYFVLGVPIGFLLAVYYRRKK